MRSVYALIPAALLAGTVLSASAEARRAEDPASHAERVSARKEHFKTAAAAKKSGKVREARSVARKTRKTAKAKTRKTASTKTASAKTASAKTRKTASAKTRKIVRVKSAKTAAAPKKRKLTQAAAPKKARKAVSKAALLDRKQMTKTVRSGPRAVKKPAKIGKVKSPVQEAMRIDGQRDIEVTRIIRDMAPAYGVPTWFALRIANVESGYNPYARGRAGEIGIYQLKCQTARGMGFSGDCSALTDTRTNVRWGLKHLSLAIASSGGNLRLAASKHNGGLGRKSLVHSYIAKVF